ncbi:MAG: flagellar motor switch protein FliM [Rickettsiaceae bacterium]|nr:flagellar motor switch protein FliM [Rickettsiaceae bacterium]
MTDQQIKKDIKATGIKALLDKALESYDKLPMLEIVFDKLVRLLTTSLRNLTSETVDIKVNGIKSQRFSSYYDTLKPPCSIIVFKIVELDNLGLVVLDNQIVFSLLDSLFGGKKHEQVQTEDGKSYTYIEQALIKQIGEVVLNELSSAFDSVSPATCVLERLENNPNFAAIARPGDAVIMLKLNIDLDGRGGSIDIVIPYATLEPIKSILQQVFLGEKFGSDATWEENILESVYSIDIPLEAVIIDKPKTLRGVANLKVGDTIVTSFKEDEDIFIRSENVNLLMGQMGRLDDKVAVSITRKYGDRSK